MNPPASSRPFSILVVCTGNICRSPLAEQLIRAQFAESGLAVTVASAGTMATPGEEMTDQAAALSVKYGGDPSAHSSQDLTAELVAGADLVLTATRVHRSAVVHLYPRSAHYAYTITQLARLITDLSLSAKPGTLPATVSDTASTYRMLQAIDEIAASRGFAPQPVQPKVDDIRDPYRQSQGTYDRVGVVVNSSITTIVDHLAGFLPALKASA